jgi:hypothetical protein
MQNRPFAGKWKIKMDNKKLVEELLRADGISPDGPAESERVAFSKLLDEHFKSGPSGLKSKWNWSDFRTNILLKTAVAAVIVIVAGILMVNKTGSLDGATIAWADVVKQFNSIAFFNASVYIKEKATDEPVQIEVWRNSQKKARIRVDGQVLFADGDRVIAGYAIDSPLRKIETEEYNEMGMAMAQKLFSFQEFSLDTVIAAFGVGKDRLKETTPLINPAAMISEDMLVFDVQSDINPEWMRIWVLRESRLPIRIRSWDPRDGDCVDIVMTYSAEQSAKFFDPNAYEQILLDVQQGSGAGGSTNLAYALLQDPGGREYTPKDLFEKAKAENVTSNAEDVSGYHLPKVEQAGVTQYGAVWVVASKAQNRTPAGRLFYGFSDIGDDLQGKYYSINSIHYTAEDISIQIFVPEDYPFDTTRPKELTLRCSVEATDPYQQEILIGNLKLDTWNKNSLWPQDRFKESELQTMIRQAWRRTGDREMCQKILVLVGQLDTENQHGHQVEKTKLRMLIQEKNYNDAALLAEKLLPAEYEVFKNAKGNASYYSFFDYIIAVAANGNVKRATDLFNEIKQLKPDLSYYKSSTRKHIMEALNRQINGDSMHGLIQPLFSAGLDLEQVNKIVGFDTLNNENTKWYVPEKFRRQRDPRVIKQEEYMKKLTEQYKKTPLKPGQMVLNQCKLKELEYMGPISEVKDHYFYIFNMELLKFLKGYKSTDLDGRINRIRVGKGVDNLMLQHEIIYNSPKGFLFEQCREFVLSKFGLEAIESQATETVLIAEYDGSQRKDYRDVRCPAVRGSTSTPGMISFRTSSGTNLPSVLIHLAKDQEILIVNETGIDDKTIITCEVPNFKTAKGMELAEKWYKDNFGITFRKEQQKLPVWVIQKVK